MYEEVDSHNQLALDDANTAMARKQVVRMGLLEMSCCNRFKGFLFNEHLNIAAADLLPPNTPNQLG